MNIVILTSWGGTFSPPVLKKLFNQNDLNIVGVFSQGVHWRKLHQLHPSIYLNYNDNVADMIERESKGHLFEIIPSVNTDEFVKYIKDCDIDYIFTVNYGEILKSEILKAPKYGVLNFHPGLLPENKGAYPVAAAVLNQHSKTGVTIHFMEEGIDSGDLVLKHEISITESYSYSGLNALLGIVATRMIDSLIEMLKKSECLIRLPQNKEYSKYYNKMEATNNCFDFSLPAKKIQDIIVLFSEFPCHDKAYFMFGDKHKIYVRHCEIIVSYEGLYKQGNLVDQGLGYLIVQVLDHLVLLSGITIDQLNEDLSNQLLYQLFKSPTDAIKTFKEE